MYAAAAYIEIPYLWLSLLYTIEINLRNYDQVWLDNGGGLAIFLVAYVAVFTNFCSIYYPSFVNAALLKSSEMKGMPLQMKQTFHSMWGVGNKRALISIH